MLEIDGSVCQCRGNRSYFLGCLFEKEVNWELRVHRCVFVFLCGTTEMREGNQKGLLQHARSPGDMCLIYDFHFFYTNSNIVYQYLFIFYYISCFVFSVKNIDRET